jgi:hypothetical protein
MKLHLVASLTSGHLSKLCTVSFIAMMKKTMPIVYRIVNYKFFFVISVQICHTKISTHTCCFCPLEQWRTNSFFHYLSNFGVVVQIFLIVISCLVTINMVSATSGGTLRARSSSQVTFKPTTHRTEHSIWLYK